MASGWNNDPRFGPQDTPHRDHAGTGVDQHAGHKTDRTDEQQGHDHGGHGGHSWMMMLMCAPMLVIVIALVAGSGGTALFGALGFVASVPFLLRLRRRFGTWRAPAIGLFIFVAMFSLSTFVIGPAISGAGGGSDIQPGPAPSVDHDGHHS